MRHDRKPKPDSRKIKSLKRVHRKTIGARPVTSNKMATGTGSK